MQDPYSVLGISSAANEGEIRARYLALVRQFPPEREPQKAAAVRAAYDAIRDPVVRLRNQLFDTRVHQTLSDLVEGNQPDIRAQRIPTEQLLSIGRS